MRCFAHILNLIVQDELTEVLKEGFYRIRDSGLFRTSDKQAQKFEQIVEQVVSDCSRKFELDCNTKWNSNYTFLW